jgi:two-component system cell cycle sensor histidine kinase/response regulator CckA
MTQIENAGLKKLSDTGLSMSLLAACFETSRDGLVVVGTSGEVLAANAELTKLLGHTPKSILSANWLSMFKTAQRIRAEDMLADIVNGKSGILKHTRMLTVDNRLVPVRIWGTLLQNGDDSFVLMTTQDLDIGSEETGEKRRMDGQIKYAQKLESLGVLAGGIAHDFNNLLVGVLGNAGLALMEMDASHPASESVRHIESAAMKASKLTEQLLLYSGKRKPTQRVVDLTTVVDGVRHLLDVCKARQVHMDYELAPDVPGIYGDPSDMQQVLINLVTNGSEAHEGDSGQVRVSVRAEVLRSEQLSQACVGSGLAAGRYVCIEVADTGRGIDDAAMAKIFDASFTTRSKGRGLGLAAVRGIVESYHGAVMIDSSKDKGTSFKVYFPARDEAIVPDAEGVASLVDWRGTGTILVVDDQESVLQVACETLAYYGFDILTAREGSEALDIMAEKGESISAVLLDMTMPGMSGEETLQELRARVPDLGVVISSGYSEAEASQRFAGYGWATFIQKPYRPVDLARRVRQLLEAHPRL